MTDVVIVFQLRKIRKKNNQDFPVLNNPCGYLGINFCVYQVYLNAP